MPERKNYYIQETFINMLRDGTFGNSMLIFVTTTRNRSNLNDEIENDSSEIVFQVKDNFDDSLLKKYENRVIHDVFNMQDLQDGTKFVAMSPIPLGIWDLERSHQVRELRSLKESLFAEVIGGSFQTDMIQLSVLLQQPFTILSDDKKAYFKKISTSFVSHTHNTPDEE